MSHSLGRRAFVFGPRAGTTMLLTAAMVLLIAMAGCSRKSFPDGDIRSIEGVYYGTIIDVTDVIVEEDPSILGPAAGATVGGILGNQFGGGTGRILLTAAGAVIGADIGYQAAKRRYPAMQLTMELDNGKVLVVVQGFDEYFVRGDRVRILHMGEGRAKVQHA